ncbi:hypothetical protein [Mammaliicoccus fleurettii]|uniref:hypothetical protein n=1 Tax=Mammaliicoccus fleurettii TaxID=150056 RepID=UPI001AAD1BED|nr:hypothetical protein [Mammaliicoccus fleurettii]MBO3063290.1 hypothetical protein [Mammaliicoccus fleurettii]
MKNKLLLLCIVLSLVLVACGSKEEEKPTTDEAGDKHGIKIDEKGNPKETIQVNDKTEKAVKEVIEQNRKSLNEGNVDEYIKTIDSNSKQLDVKEEEKVLKDTLKNYKFDKKISNIKFLEDKKDQVVVFYSAETTAHPKDGSKEEKKSFKEAVTLIKKGDTYKISHVEPYAI